jgi:L-alanine-DL-glutamate epimerase-like enolase superfamily enzyme
MPIAAGESEFTRFDFRDLINARAIDIRQPDMAICGGLTEEMRIAALAMTHQLAPTRPGLGVTPNPDFIRRYSK